MLGYLTIGDSPSGIFSSQVIDTCRFLSEISGKKVKLFSLVTIRGFWSKRMKIKEEYPNSFVFPMFPKLENWRLNYFSLFFIFHYFKGYSIFCRQSIPTVLAVKLRKKGLVNKVVYDARGCEYEQIVEYNVIENEKLTKDFKKNEEMSSNDSDIQLSVSKALIEYWREKFHYLKHDYFIIPSTFPIDLHKDEDLSLSRESLGFSKEDLIFVYSGSVSGWQSFKLMFSFLQQHLKIYPNLKILLLTQKTQEVIRFVNMFEDRVLHFWLPTNKVKSYLELADYGILIREKSVTNFVASPIKFAEYLQAGLKVIVNEGSIEQSISFIAKHQCGIIYNGEEVVELAPLRLDEKAINKSLAAMYYSKQGDKNKALYKQIVTQC